MPERLKPVRVIQVGVEAEDLTEDGFDVAKSRLREAGCFANPVVTGEYRERSSEVGGTHGDWSGRTGRVETSRSERWSHVAWSFGREGFWVVNLSYNPTLYQGDVLIGGNLDGDFFVVEPGVSVTTAAEVRR